MHTPVEIDASQTETGLIRVEVLYTNRQGGARFRAVGTGPTYKDAMLAAAAHAESIAKLRDIEVQLPLPL